MTHPALQKLTSDSVAACGAVLARLWILGPGDRCSVCPMRAECPEQTSCLHLVASAGTTARTDGGFRRFPIGAREVGMTVLRRQPWIARSAIAERGLAEATWLAAHQVKSFVAIPLVRGDVGVGVLAIFSRRGVTEAEARLIAFAADQALAASEVEVATAVPIASTTQPSAAPPSRSTTAPTPNDLRTLAEIQREAIERALEQTGGRISGPDGAGALLGLHPNTLTSRMKKLGVERRRA